MIIKQISFAEILPVWEQLWTNRTSPIEPTSAVTYNTHPYKLNPAYSEVKPIFLGAYVGDELVGVNSCHKTSKSFRSRGLFVLPEHRGLSIGAKLLAESVAVARKARAEFMWSIPRSQALKSYEAVGFVRTSGWFETETHEKNCYVRLVF